VYRRPVTRQPLGSPSWRAQSPSFFSFHRFVQESRVWLAVLLILSSIALSLIFFVMLREVYLIEHEDTA
jgi:hypothetical protein